MLVYAFVFFGGGASLFVVCFLFFVSFVTFFFLVEFMGLFAVQSLCLEAVSYTKWNTASSDDMLVQPFQNVGSIAVTVYTHIVNRIYNNDKKYLFLKKKLKFLTKIFYLVACTTLNNCSCIGYLH